MKKTLIFIIIILAVIAVVSYSKFPVSKENSEQIKIAAVLSLSGDAAYDGESIRDGIELAKSDLAKEGVDLEVTYEDDETDVAKTLSALQKVIAIEKPHAIIGPTWSFLASASAGLLKDNNIPAFQPANTSEFVEANGAPIFFGTVKNAMKEEPVTEFLKKYDAKRVAVIIDGTAWGHSHIDVFKKSAENVSAEIVLQEEINFGAETNRMADIMSKVANSEIDAILWTGFESEALIMLKKHVEFGLTMPILGESLLVDGNRKEIAKEVKGEIYILNPDSSVEFRKKFSDHYGYDPDGYADSAYDGTMMLVEAIQNTDGSHEAVIEYLSNVTDYDGYFTHYNFDENGDVEGGRWVLSEFEG